MVEALGQAVLHGQAEGVEKITPSVVALDQRLAVLLRDAELVERAWCQALAFQAEQHRLDGHQAPQRLDQPLAEHRLGDAGHGPRQPRMPGMQGGGGGRTGGVVGHAGQSSGAARQPPDTISCPHRRHFA
ncbi:hypothetical protein FQZ97_1041670 [compost metagenome]